MTLAWILVERNTIVDHVNLMLLCKNVMALNLLTEQYKVMFFNQHRHSVAIIFEYWAKNWWYLFEKTVL